MFPINAFRMKQIIITWPHFIDKHTNVEKKTDASIAEKTVIYTDIYHDITYQNFKVYFFPFREYGKWQFLLYYLVLKATIPLCVKPIKKYPPPTLN